MPPPTLPSAPSMVSVGVKFKFPITDAELTSDANPTGKVDLTLYTTKRVTFTRPDKSTVTHDAATLGLETDGVIFYENDVAFFAAAKGLWHVFGYIEADSMHKYKTVVGSFYVGE